MSMYSSFAQPPAISGSPAEAWELNAGQMARLLNGKLILSSTPPVGGKLEPVGRVVPDLQDYLGGDLVVLQEACSAGSFVEQPMLCGATGIVANRPIEPWPGCYQILVHDVGNSVQRLADYRRSRFGGKVIAVITHEKTWDPRWQWIMSKPGQDTVWIWVQAHQLDDLCWCNPHEVLDERGKDSSRA